MTIPCDADVEWIQGHEFKSYRARQTEQVLAEMQAFSRLVKKYVDHDV